MPSPLFFLSVAVLRVLCVFAVRQPLLYAHPMATPEEAFLELRAVYAALAGELEPFRRHCDSRGVCCNFTHSGHMLYVTNLEAAEMANSGQAPRTEQAGAGVCPYLNGRLCGVRDHRALGCRIYFCDRTYEEERNALYERFLREIRAIEARHGLAHFYRPVIQVDFNELHGKTSE